MPTPAGRAAPPAGRCRGRGATDGLGRWQPDPGRPRARWRVGSPPSSARPPSGEGCHRGPPPRAWSLPSVAESGDHDRLDGVQAVLGLVEDDGVLRLEDLVGDLATL